MDYWYSNANFYHIYIFGLCDTAFNNDYSISKHKLEVIEKWIPHIKEMGCNAIYFSPVFQSKTHGYDVTDYNKIDNRIGNNVEFKLLVEKLHQNGLKVILDAVFNHCGRDFFAFSDLKERGRSSNYAEWFSGVNFEKSSPLGDTFTYDTWNGYFELVKFNLKNVNVKKYLLNVVRYWIEYFNIDGLRLDAADCLDFEFMRELRQFTISIKYDFWLMGEVLHGDYSRWVNGETLHSVTNYELYKSLYSSHNDNNLYELSYSLNRCFDFEKGIYKNLLLYNFTDNHDLNRLASLVTDPAYLYTIYILLYTMPGIPSLYYGSEWGIKGEKSNNSDQALRPYINIFNIKETSHNLLDTIKKLSDIRNKTAALQKGKYKQLFISYQQPFAFERMLDGERIIVIVNINKYPAYVSLAQYATCFNDILNNENIDMNSGTELTISPNWGRILRIIK